MKANAVGYVAVGGAGVGCIDDGGGYGYGYDGGVDDVDGDEGEHINARPRASASW